MEHGSLYKGKRKRGNYDAADDYAAAQEGALVYPVTGYNVDEQIIRSNKLEALGEVSVIRPEELTPEVLGRKIHSALGRKPSRAGAALDIRGVENTANILMELASSGSETIRSGSRTEGIAT